MKISGARVLVTGASRGIGAATARVMAARGAFVRLVARDASALEQVADEINQAGGHALACPADLSDAAAVERLFEPIAASSDWPDILINSAGAGRWLYTEETSPAEAAQMMGAPYFAAFHVTRQCLPAMLRRRRGRIVMVNSPVARGAWPSAAGYTAARYALQGFTNALQLDLHGTGVGVTSIVPGVVSSDYFTRNAGVADRLPTLSRLLPTLTPEQVAQAILKGVTSERREVILPAMLRVMFAFNTLAPRLAEWLILRTGWQRPDA